MEEILEIESFLRFSVFNFKYWNLFDFLLFGIWDLSHFSLLKSNNPGYND